MAINHPVYLQRAEKGPLGKVTLIAIVDAESVGMKDTDDCVWMMATTTPSSMYTGHKPSISLEIKSKMSSEDYVNGLTMSKTITIRMDEEVLKQIDAQALKNHRSRNGEIEEILEKSFEKKEEV
jgi:hypothetical protein